jgi:hypothetical protein
LQANVFALLLAPVAIQGLHARKNLTQQYFEEGHNE